MQNLWSTKVVITSCCCCFNAGGPLVIISRGRGEGKRGGGGGIKRDKGRDRQFLTLLCILQYLVSTKLKQDEKAQIRHKYALAKVKLAKVQYLMN